MQPHMHKSITHSIFCIRKINNIIRHSYRKSYLLFSGIFLNFLFSKTRNLFKIWKMNNFFKFVFELNIYQRQENEGNSLQVSIIRFGFRYRTWYLAFNLGYKCLVLAQNLSEVIKDPLQVAKHIIRVNVLVAVELNAHLRQILIEQCDGMGKQRILRWRVVLEEWVFAVVFWLDLLHYEWLGASEYDRMTQRCVQYVGKYCQSMDYISYRHKNKMCIKKSYVNGSQQLNVRFHFILGELISIHNFGLRNTISNPQAIYTLRIS